jgi:rare lipoprotein A
MLPPKLILFCGALLASVPARAQTVASWYGPGFHGRTTASGCIYNMYALTAASRVFPMGTVLAVTYNGRTVEVVINDRGPYVRGRGLDLSRAAAARLDLLGVGVARVDVRVVGTSPLRCRPASPRSAIAATGRTG